MKPDAIFRIYSMTKPIVSVAVMQMAEEGKLQVSDPVSKFLPEIGKMKVGTEKVVDGRAVLQLGDPERAMTVQDLLRHTSGLTYGTRGTALVNQSYVDAKIGDRGMSNEEFVPVSTLALSSRRARAGYGGSTECWPLSNGHARSALGLGHGIFKPWAWSRPLPGAADSFHGAQPGPRPNGQPMMPRFGGNDGAKYDRVRRTHLDHGRHLRFTPCCNGCAFPAARARQADAGFMTATYRQPSRPSACTASVSASGGRTMTARRRCRVRSASMAGRHPPLFWIDPRSSSSHLHGAGERSGRIARATSQGKGQPRSSMKRERP